MCAITVPFTIVWMSAFENSIPNARPAAPSAKMPDSASAAEVTLPEAMMFAVLRASMPRALGDRDAWSTRRRCSRARASATCFAPGFGVLSIVRSVDALIEPLRSRPP